MGRRRDAAPTHRRRSRPAGPDARLAPAEAGRDGAGRRRPLLRPAARLRAAGRDEHGDAARRGRRGAPPAASSDVDGAAGEVGARLDRRPGAPDRPLRRGLGAARGRRQDRPRPRRPAADLHRSDARSAGGSCAAASRTRSSSRPPTPAAGARRGACRSTRSRCRAARSSRRWRRRSSPARRSALRLTVSRTAKAGDGTGFVVLTRGSDVRRVAFWFHVEVPRLAARPAPDAAHARPLPRRHGREGVARLLLSLSRARPRGRGADAPRRARAGVPVHAAAAGRELRRRRSSRHARGVRVSPRLVAGDDENRVVGYTGIPASLNPYQGFDRAEPVVGAVLPDPGTYEFVFDTPTGAKPGAFTFRFWVNDTSPPSIRLLDRHARCSGGRSASPSATRAPGSTRSSFHAKVGGKPSRFTLRRRRALAPDEGPAPPGKQAVTVTRVGLPGDEEHGGRRAGAPEHPRPPHAP